MSRHLYSLIYFWFTFFCVKERQFRSSYAVTSISVLWLVMALPWESNSEEILSGQVTARVSTLISNFNSEHLTTKIEVTRDGYLRKRLSEY